MRIKNFQGKNYATNYSLWPPDKDLSPEITAKLLPKALNFTILYKKLNLIKAKILHIIQQEYQLVDSCPKGIVIIVLHA